MLRRSPASRSVPALIALTLFVASCGSDDSSSDSTPADNSSVETTAPESSTTDPPITLDPAELAPAYTERGEYPVGVTTLTRSSDQKVEVWYPAVDGTTGEETYDVRDFTPPAIQALLTGDAAATFTYEAGRDADAADGTFPVVLFSHGYTGMRLQSSFLTAHLASHGMIVVSTDHPSRDLYNVLGGTAANAAQDSVADLLESLELVVAENEIAGSILEGHVDADRVAAVGHSAGGGTVLNAASDDRIDAYVSLASGALAPEGQPAPELPNKPSFFMAGSLDGVVPPDERTRPAFEAAPSPSLLWVIDQVGHNGFDDFCTFGNGAGIIGVAEASGLGPLLDSQPQLRKLGEDGCKEPNIPVQDAWPIIRHAVTAYLLWQFGVDAQPLGLDDSVADAYVVPVEIASK